MKKLITLILVFCSILSFGQFNVSVSPQGQPNQFIKWKGGIGADSIFKIPIRDTIIWDNQWGNLTIQPTVMKLFVRLGTHWYEVNTGSSLNLNLSNSDLVQTDLIRSYKIGPDNSSSSKLNFTGGDLWLGGGVDNEEYRGINFWDGATESWLSIRGTDAGVSITSGSNNVLTVQDDGYLFGVNGFFNLSGLTSLRSFSWPNASGTIALTSDLGSYVPLTRSLTINGSTQDLSGNRIWTIPTLYSGNSSLSSNRMINGNGYYLLSSNTSYVGFSDRTTVSWGTDPGAKINFKGANNNSTAVLQTSLLTTLRTYQFPNNSGTIALTSDLSGLFLTGTYSAPATARAANTWTSLGTVTITGAVVGRPCNITQPNNGLMYKAVVTSSNTVTVSVHNPTSASITPTAETLTIIVF